jgi:hypothetical protein
MTSNQRMELTAPARRSSYAALGVMASLAEFEWYDAWILAAVVYASEGSAPVSLWRLIAIADALNKAIVSRGELELGIGRLVGAGYIRVVAEGFQATPSALALKVPGPPMENVANAIGARKWSAQAEMPRVTTATYVTAEAYEKAAKRYRKQFWKEYRNRVEKSDA